MGYYEEAKHTCPLCKSDMATLTENGWDEYECTNADCHIRWWHRDFEESVLPAERVIELTDGRHRLCIECIEGHETSTTITRVPKPRKRFEKKQPRQETQVTVHSSLWSTDIDRVDKSLREAFSTWRVRNIV